MIQSVLRHKNPTMTNRYLRSMGLEQVREGLEKGLKRSGELIKFTPKKVGNGNK
jgi:hypothetical protein